MYKIYRVSTVILLSLVCLSSFGQLNTRSAYSRFGVGELYQNGNGYVLGMGGAGIGMRLKNQMNLLNPASFTAQDTLTFLFDFGLSFNQSNYSSNSGSVKTSGGGLSHIAISFPIFKWWIANIGMTPYSKVGYNIRSEVPRNGYISPFDTYYKGSGGLNRYFFSTAFALKNLSIGANAYYLLGSLNVNKSYNFWHGRDLNTTFNTTWENEYSISDIYFGIGAQYSFTLSEDFKGVLGFTYDFEKNLKTQTSSFVYSDYNSSSSSYYLPQDTILFIKESPSSMKLPAKYGIGASVEYKGKFVAAFDYSVQDWTGFKYPMASTDNILTKAQSYNLGFQYIPNRNAVRGYLNHMSFRTGAFYNQTYMKFKNEQINDYGMSFGLGLPFRNSGSVINLNYELGRRGTLKNGLIQENYQYIYISLTLRDFWFQKAKFD